MTQILIFIGSFVAAFAYSRFERDNNKYYRRWYNLWNSKKRKKTEENCTQGFFFQRSWQRILANALFALTLVSLALWTFNTFILSFGLALTIDSFGLWASCYFGILAGVGLLNLPTFMRELKEGKGKELVDTAKAATIAVVENTSEGIKDVVNETKDVFDDEDPEESDTTEDEEVKANESKTVVEDKVEEENNAEEVLELKDKDEVVEKMELKDLDEADEPEEESARTKIRNRLNR